MSIGGDDTGHEPPGSSSPSDHVLSELQLYGYRPFQYEPAPAPTVATAVADIFGAPVGTLSDTRLEPNRAPLLHGVLSRPAR
jgi:hypothetical protein